MRVGNIEFGYSIEAKGKTPSLFQQVHGTKILQYPRESTDLLEADGGMTSEKNLELFVFSADCMPALFFSEEPEAPIVAVHSGWRGTKDGILKAASSQFKNPSTTHVWIGPHIRPCCFEVKQDFIDAFKAAGRVPEPFLSSESHFDLLAFALATDLMGIGNLHLEDVNCTVCSTPKLPSYRRQKSTDPRIRSWIRKT